MMLRVMILFMIISTKAFGVNWYCTDVASERMGNIIRACGVGEGGDENEARTKAFENAKNEFSNICSNSDDCKNHRITISPQRTACETRGKSHKCYRLIEFTILDRVNVLKPNPGLEVYRSGKMPKGIDKSEVIKPFYYEDIEQFPKIRNGYTKKQLLEMFGTPYDVRKEYGRGSGAIRVLYSCSTVKFCAPNANEYAYVIIENDEVVHFENFHFKYTEDLKQK